MTYKPAILVPRDSTYPVRSRPYLLPWCNLGGLYEFKIIQHVPESEIEQAGFEYRFVEAHRFRVASPDTCRVIIQMGYNANREIEVVIKNAFGNESATYVGISQPTCVGMNYPLTVKQPSKPIEPDPDPWDEPSPEEVRAFFDYVQNVVRFIRIKADGFPVPQMLTAQQLDEIRQLLNRDEPTDRIVFTQVYNTVNSALDNSRSRGLLSQEEHAKWTNGLARYADKLFRLKKKY